MTTTKTLKPTFVLSTKELIYRARRPSHAQHAEAYTEIERRFAKTTRPSSVLKLGAFLDAYSLDGKRATVATEVPEKI